MNSINEHILNRIDEFCQERNAAEGRRSHLGASVIGEDCERKNWYSFRWAKEQKFEAHTLRLFKRGHEEEPRFVEYLEGVGVKVQETDEEGKQWRMSMVNGHAGGSCDGKAYFPEEWRPFLPKDFDFSKPVLLEMKTAADSSFKQTKKDGVRVSKPQHWSQICAYGFGMGIKYVLYLMVNKNNDHLHIEFLEIDHSEGEQMVNLAKGIVFNPEPPMRRYAKSYWKCNSCPYKKVCHFDEPMDKNCRSCKNGKPAKDGGWICGLCDSKIPDDVIPKGCDQWIQLDNV